MVYSEVKRGEVLVCRPISPLFDHPFLRDTLVLGDLWDVVGTCMVEDYLVAEWVIFECSIGEHGVRALFYKSGDICISTLDSE